MTERIKEAAQMAALGLDPFRFLYSRDAMELSLLTELHNQVLEIRKMMDHNLAVEIANNVGKLFKR
jgi:hypothetical protein